MNNWLAWSGWLSAGNTAIEVGAENFLGASHLPRREPASGRPRQRSHAAIGLGNMYPERQEDVVDEQLACLVGTAERRQHRHPET